MLSRFYPAAPAPEFAKVFGNYHLDKAEPVGWNYVPGGAA
jgi:hypothetical protein